jgi:hypothetical protein
MPSSFIVRLFGKARGDARRCNRRHRAGGFELRPLADGRAASRYDHSRTRLPGSEALNLAKAAAVIARDVPEEDDYVEAAAQAAIVAARERTVIAKASIQSPAMKNGKRAFPLNFQKDTPYLDYGRCQTNRRPESSFSAEAFDRSWSNAH